MPRIAKSKRLKHVKKHGKKPSKEPEPKAAGSQDCSNDSPLVPTDAECASPTLSINDESSCMSYPDSEHSYQSLDDTHQTIEIIEETIFASKDVLLEARKKLSAFLPNYWTCIVTDCSGLSVVMLSRQSQLSLQRSVIFSVNGEVTVNVHCKEVSSDPFLKGVAPAAPLQDFDDINYFVDRAVTVINNVRLMEICAGVDNEAFSASWSYCSNVGSIDLNPYKECRYAETFRSHDCKLVVESNKWRCLSCIKIVKILKRKTESLEKAEEGRSNKTANIYLTEEEKLKKLSDQQKTIDAKNQVIRRLTQRMNELIQKEGKKIDQDIAADLNNVLRDAKLSPAMSIFVQQQVKASQLNNKCSMKWHPAVIRLALSIFEVSRSAYERLRDSGFVKLPCARTLYDYTHYADIKPGVDPVVLESVSERVALLPEKKSYHVFMADEMYISKNLVYKKGSGELIGYTSLNNVDNELKTLDEYFNNPGATVKPEVATKILCYLVKGVASGIKEVVASYAVNSVSPKQMYSWTWKLISTLERCGVRIIAFICDGCAINRAFIKMHTPSHDVRKSKVVYATVNKAAPERQLFFISDVPHLLKTLRNSFFRSRLSKKGKRCMTKGGQKIVWDHIIKLYNAKKGKVLRKSYKLTAQHVYPDSYSCMKVAPAAQVFSKTVCKDLRAQKWAGTTETCDFIERVNDWFDSLNGAHTAQGKRTRNRRLDPYTSLDDFRFEEQNEFLKYLEDWTEEAYSSAADTTGTSMMSGNEEEEEYVALWGEEDDEEGETTRADKKLPARQTLLGIEMATLAIQGAIKFLLDKENGAGLDFVNARIFCQDPLEHYFGKQRAGCGGSVNPNLSEFLNKGRVSHVVGQIGIKRKGNSTEVDLHDITSSDNPLKKRRTVRRTI